MFVKIVVGINAQGLIGVQEYNQHTLPWPYLKDDMNYFRTLTCEAPEECHNVLIVGHNTWHHFKNQSTLLQSEQRHWIIVTRDTIDDARITTCDTVLQAYYAAKSREHVHNIFIVGGARIYHEAMMHLKIDQICIVKNSTTFSYAYEVQKRIYFPLTNEQMAICLAQKYLSIHHQNEIYDITKNVTLNIHTYDVHDEFKSWYFSQCYLHEMKGQYTFVETIEPKSNTSFSLKHIEEYQHLELIRQIQASPAQFGRNGSTRSVFGVHCKYDLREGFPLPTIKKCYPKMIFEELMWILRGQTDVSILQAQNVQIWNKNSSAEYLQALGLPWQANDIGPGYGFQMRHFGASYVNCKTDYTGQGIDQLQNCIDLLNHDPTSRRIIISLWNPCDLTLQALPPCHVMYQFKVDLYDEPINGKRGLLHCHLIQRSWDVLLGWNVPTAAMFTHLLATHTHLNVGWLAHAVTDAHIYVEHESGVNELLMRKPRDLPQLHVLHERDAITNYEFTDLCIEGYQPCPPIAFDMKA